MLPGIPATGLNGVTVDTDAVVRQMVRRASSPGFDTWWRRAESVGFCAHPIQLTGTDRYGRQQIVWTRCNNRRAQVCPSCSDLYARDTWQLVHAGAAGGHHDVPATIATHPQVFATLTAPGFGAVHHHTGTTCRDAHRLGGYRRCPHGKPLWCSRIHHHDDAAVGQPLCLDCYDYPAHVLFTWHLPELWRRFTIALRRIVRRELKTLGVDPDSVRVSFVKVVEMQARAVPHIHALIRLDPTESTDDATTSAPCDDGRAAGGGAEPRHATGPSWEAPIAAATLAVLIKQTAGQISITVPSPDHPRDADRLTDMAADIAATTVVRFGHQADTQPLSVPTPAEQHETANSPERLSPRRVARYLAKYVTKSLQDFGIAARRLSSESVASLDVSEHVRSILSTIARLADTNTHVDAGNTVAVAGIGRWLHTLGYRGHITTKSRRYSVTMTALRATRAAWTRQRNTKPEAAQHHQQQRATEDIGWEFDRAGHATTGDRVLAVSASLRHIDARLAGLEQRHLAAAGWEVPDG
ncbi:plasmid replication initiator protein [Mycolicibacterium mucogenicum]|uniref:replication initiator n=1 Tax=Mycolicibacterium mucogenicum TaxID=56689 RepID=UPI002269FFDC|nr:replication initiator [Mycolicibacterium mucogenicum]MCX8557221.1 plasmid replication initiator protein [Mycolicibacterium mucogenicum]